MSFFGWIDGWRLSRNILKFVNGLFNAAEKLYNKLPKEVQDALVHGSGLMAILNSELDKTPEELRAIIRAKYPDIDESVLEAGLISLAHSFGLVPASNSFEDVVKAIQGHISNLHGTAWEAIQHAGASLLAIFFAPTGTKFGSIISILEWVYNHFIKKQNTVTVPTSDSVSV